MIRKDTFYLLCLLLAAVGFYPLQGFSQSGSTALPTILPPSPTVAELGKYVEVPVSTYTGIPDISVPLLDIKSRDITVPISLSYHAGGNQVAEEASWVGLGWSLNAGGVIGRTVRGKDDFIYYLFSGVGMSPTAAPMPDFYYPGYSEECNGFTAGGQQVNYCSAPPIDDSDWEPDAFFFNFAGQSGKFVLDQQGIPHLLEQSKIKIIPPAPGGQGFTVITPDGFRYDFFATETTYALSNSGYNGAISSWYLSKITSPTAEEVIFTYESSNGSVFPVSSFSQVTSPQNTGGCSPNQVESGGYTTSVSAVKYLSRIDFKTGYVTFERDIQTREDLREGQRLKYVKLYEQNVSNPIREFELVSSYFVSPTESRGSTNYSLNAQEHSYAGKRLRLDQVIERGGGLQNPPYRFSYSNIKLPYKTSFDRDHWGFFNAANNSVFMPRFEGVSTINNRYVTIYGANREPNPAAVTACILQQIQNPSGGKTNFAYESNEYGNISTEEQWSNQTIIASQRWFPNSPLDTQSAPPFTVVDTPGLIGGGASIDITGTLQGCTQGCQDNNTYIQLRQLNGSFIATWSIANRGTGNFTETLTVPSGQYELLARANTSGAMSSAWGQLTIRVVTPIYKSLGGGVRIASITVEDGLSATPTLAHIYKYDKNVVDALGIHPSSYGILMSRPRYDRYLMLPYFNVNGDVSYCRALQLCTYSNSQLSSSAQGASIGYSQVEEWLGLQGEGGKTVFEYENAPDIVYDYKERGPGIPNIPSPLNGYLKRRVKYSKNDGQFRKVNEMVHEYEAINKVNIRGVARGPITRLILPNAYGCLACSIPLDRYAIFSYLIRAIASTERQYDVLDEARFLQSTTSYIYETGTPVHMQISGTQTLCSDGSTIVKRMTYPADYTSVTTGPLAQMRSDAMYQHSAVVESITQVYGPNESPAQAKTISGTYTEYAQPAPTGKYLPVVQRALELPEPTPNLTVAAPSLPPLGRYVDKVYLSYYPASANLQQAQIVHDVPTSYVWGYQNTLPIAKIENASASQVQAALTAMNVDPNTVNIDADLRSAFAQLRARLPMARVTGMTYAPLVGMTSQTDANGRSFFYEYDALGRLLRTRDEQNRILTQTEYHYARP